MKKLMPEIKKRNNVIQLIIVLLIFLVLTFQLFVYMCVSAEVEEEPGKRSNKKTKKKGRFTILEKIRSSLQHYAMLDEARPYCVKHMGEKKFEKNAIIYPV